VSVDQLEKILHPIDKPLAPFPADNESSRRSLKGGIVSRGDSVLPGIYPFHSRFERVVNFFAVDHLISLVKEEVGAGPSHIVLRNADLCRAGEALEITPSGMETGGLRFSWPSDAPHSSVSDWSLPKGGVPKAMWDLVIENIVRQAPAGSAVFVLSESGPRIADGSFEAIAVRRIRAGAEKLRSGDRVAGAKFLRGVGFGLTPTGDDVLAGFMTGLHLIRIPRERIEEIYTASLGDNAISNSMLFFAKEGRVFEGTRRLLSAVCRGSTEEIPGAVASLISRGATSGADFAVGLVLGVQQPN
jgi:hypothetical protein